MNAKIFQQPTVVSSNQESSQQKKFPECSKKKDFDEVTGFDDEEKMNFHVSLADVKCQNDIRSQTIKSSAPTTSATTTTKATATTTAAIHSSADSTPTNPASHKNFDNYKTFKISAQLLEAAFVIEELRCNVLKYLEENQ